MVDFSALLHAPAGEAKKPPPLPAAEYPAIIKNWEIGDQNKNKTPYVRFHIGLIGWPDHIEEDQRMYEGKLIDLSKRQMRKDFYFGEGQWRLDEFIKQCGLHPNGKSYGELFPEMIGIQIFATVAQFLFEKSGEVGNQIDTVRGQHEI